MARPDILSVEAEPVLAIMCLQKDKGPGNISGNYGTNRKRFSGKRGSDPGTLISLPACFNSYCLGSALSIVHSSEEKNCTVQENKCAQTRVHCKVSTI